MKHKSILKITFLILDFALLALAIALIPLNLFVVNFPEWLTGFFGVIAVMGLVGYLLLFQTKLLTKIFLPLVFLATAVITALFPYHFPYWNSYSFKDCSAESLNYDAVISYDAAKKDLDTMIACLQKVHPMFQNGLTEEIENGYSASLARLKAAGTITVNDLRRKIQSVLNPMHDAHTTIYNGYPADRYLKTIPKMLRDGYAIDSVNGKTGAEIFEAAKPYVSYESEAWITIDLGSLAFLDFYGYSAPFTFVWSDGEGSSMTEVYTEDDFVPYAEYLDIYEEYFPQTETHDFVYYEIDEEKSLAVLTLTQCDYNQTYVDCVRRMFTEVKEKGIGNVAVDVRGNGGGNSTVVNEFIKYLPTERYHGGGSDIRYGAFTVHQDGICKNARYTDLTFEGKVYVLTNHDSFSSAMMFAMMIQDNGLGEVIGEFPANAVNGYGDIVIFRLPNTGMMLAVSRKKWYRADEKNPDEYVMPNYPCDSRDVFETLYGLL